MWQRVSILALVGLAVLAVARAFGGPESTGSAEVRLYRGRPTVFVDGEALAIAAYSPPAQQPQALRNTRRFFAHDMTVYFLNVPRGRAAPGAEEWSPNVFWEGDRIEAGYVRELVTPSLDEQARFILEHAPEARFIVRFGPHEPRTWRALHPDELFVNEYGERLPHPSLASARYATDSARMIEAAIRFCEGHAWASRIVGYWTGHRVEGSHQPVIEGYMFDHGEAMSTRWRRFLSEKYGDDRRLQAAWRQPEASLATARAPRDPLRAGIRQVADSLYWQPAAQNQALRDYYALNAQLFHELFVAQAEAHHRGTDRKRIFLIDALKQPMLGWDNSSFFARGKSWPLAYHEMQSGSGNMHVAGLLDLQTFDGLITPHDYQARGVGGVYQPEGIVESALLRGKLFFSEMDTRSYTARHDRIANARDDREFAAITWRNLATSLAGGYQSYWMDVFEDWFGSPEIHAIIQRQVEVLNQAVDWPHEDVPGIAVILDDACVYETNGNGAFLNQAVMWELKMGLPRCGVPFRIYLLEDLALDAFPEHRVFYFPNLFKVDDRRLELLQRKVFGRGRVVVWGPGSGISDGETIAPRHATRLTGFSFDLLEANAPRRVLTTDYEHPITRSLSPGTIFGGPLAYGPVLIPTDGQSLASLWTKGGINASGVAVREFANESDGWTSVFVTAVPLPVELWRGFARHAGAHIYSDSHDVLLANRYLVALHSVRSERKTIRLPEPARVTDVVTGDVVAEATETIVFDLVAPGTAVFRLEPLPPPPPATNE